MNRISILFTAFAGSLILASCDKQLSEPPANARVEGTAITDQKSAQTVLNGAYYRLAAVDANNVTDMRTHHLPGAMASGWLGNGLGQLQDEINNNVNASYAPQIWNESYLLINAANGLIDGVLALPDEKFTGTRKDELLAEARFLRAYGHFRLLVFFGEWFKPNSAFGVLLRDQLSRLSTIAKARSSVAESYTLILEDLDFAAANGPAANPNHYATKWAAMALKMRVLINRGQGDDYSKIITLGNTLMQNGGYALEPNLKDLFYTKGLASKEVILGTKPQPNQQDFYYILSRSYYPIQSSLFVAKQPFKDLLSADPRGTWMVGPQTPYQAYSPNTYYFTKYIPYGTATSVNSETSYLFRLSEVYLLTAEAIIRSGGDLNTAKTLIKTVMGKGGVTDFSAIDNAATTSALLVQNYYEVSRCLMGEDNIEWFTLLRLPFETVKQLKPTITSQIQYYFPVPQDEFTTNPAFGQQNPGYGI